MAYFCVGTCCCTDESALSRTSHAHDGNQYVLRIRHISCVNGIKREDGDRKLRMFKVVYINGCVVARALE